MSDEHENGTALQSSSDDHAKALQRDIEKIRGNLGGMVSELDRRRHDLFDVRKQVGRHAVPLALTGLALLGAAAGGIVLAVHRRRRRKAFGARLVRLRRALGRMIDEPERVARASGPGRKIASAGAAAVVSVMARRLAERAARAT
jgi:hypothetical protein